MITARELNKFNLPTTPEIDANLATLLEHLNRLRTAYGKAMYVTSGLRSDSQQAALIKAGKSTAKKSKHLSGQAADIADVDGKFWAWCMDNLALLEEVGIWLEDKVSTPEWVHCQCVAPGSGKRIFQP